MLGRRRTRRRQRVLAPRHHHASGRPASPFRRSSSNPPESCLYGSADLWRYRELVYFLFWRDVKVRYKQTVLGAAWAILQPVATMIVFTVFLGRLAKISSDGIPYSLFVFSGLLPWQLFAFSLTESSTSLVNSKQLITKVYFPRLIIPISAVLVGLVDFAVASLVLVVLMAYHHVVPALESCLLPLLVAVRRVLGALGRAVPVGAQRAVSRCSLHDPVSDSGLDVRDADRLSEQPGSGRSGAFSMVSTRWPGSSRAFGGRCSAPRPGAVRSSRSRS